MIHLFEENDIISFKCWPNCLTCLVLYKRITSSIWHHRLDAVCIILFHMEHESWVCLPLVYKIIKNVNIIPGLKLWNTDCQIVAIIVLPFTFTALDKELLLAPQFLALELLPTTALACQKKSGLLRGQSCGQNTSNNELETLTVSLHIELC